MENLWSLSLPALGAIALWVLNAFAQRAWEHRAAKRDVYEQIVRAAEGLQAGVNDQERLKQFLTEIRKAWLYCPENVIFKANELTDALQHEGQGEATQKYKEFMLEIRRDIFDIRKRPNFRTGLTPDHVRILQVKNRNL